MKIAAFIDYFIHKDRFEDHNELRRARLFVRASFLTSLFSNSYIWSSMYFEYDKGVHLMIFNVIGFMLLPFLSKTKLPITWLGNLYIFIGAFAVLVLTFFSGGLWSSVYPWIISIPVLALLVVNKFSGYMWGAISFIAMIYFGVVALKGIQLPLEYNVEMKTEWFVTVLPGLLLIILFISFVFEDSQTKALLDLETKNELLKAQKETISEQSIELEELIEEKNYIIRVLAHDLRNPLKNIGGLIELMKNDSDPAKHGDYFGMISQSSINAQDLVNKVLEMDASEQKDSVLELTLNDANKVLTNVVESMRKVAESKSIEIKVENRANETNLLADETYLRSVFENLLSNAIKFSESNNIVKTTIENVDRKVQIKVADQGQGINEEEVGLLFQKFTKLSARPTAGESSTGLGLSLVKRYVELMNGHVWYENGEEGGATFVVEFPLVS